MSNPQILWLRRDLRLADQAALAAAAAAGPVIAVYILDDETPRHRVMGAASRWWLHHSLAELSRSLADRGSRLILRRGRVDDVLSQLAQETDAAAVHALHHYEPWWRNAEVAVRKALPANVPLHLHDGNYLLPPGTVRTIGGEIYKIYTPFWRALNQRMPPPPPQPVPVRIAAPAQWPQSDDLTAWQLLPRHPDWAGGFRSEWTPGENGAQERLDRFLAVVGDYDTARNRPSEEGSSRLSPHVHFGEISPATVWHCVAGRGAANETYLKELVWRDYAQNLILAYPDYGRVPGKPAFGDFPWRDPSQPDVHRDIDAWKAGRTGYPIVDAGMRQLWASGWMHNRVRMIAASFLVKHLLVDWRVGEQWFWDTLIDADYASNATNWQWIAGSGVDASMFVRIMAPLLQSEKFNAAGYIRQWLPELAHLDDTSIHDPWNDGRTAKGYPLPIIDHRQARERALTAFRTMKA